jgi:hypothetical protein
MTASFRLPPLETSVILRFDKKRKYLRQCKVVAENRPEKNASLAQ